MKHYSLTLLISMAVWIFFSCQPSDKTTEEKDEKEETGEAKAPIEDVDTIEFIINAIGNTMEDIRFDIEEIQVSPNAFIRITLINGSEDPHMEHNIVFIKEGGNVQEIMMEGLQAGRDKHYLPDNKDKLIGWSKIAKPGEIVHAEFNAPSKEGTYTYVCLYPGHIDAMRGKLIVTR